MRYDRNDLLSIATRAGEAFSDFVGRQNERLGTFALEFNFHAIHGVENPSISNRSGDSVFIYRDEDEVGFCHFLLFFERAASGRENVYMNLDRCATDLGRVSIEAHHVTDIHRGDEIDLVHGDGNELFGCMLRGFDCACKVDMTEQNSSKYGPTFVGVPGKHYDSNRGVGVFLVIHGAHCIGIAES